MAFIYANGTWSVAAPAADLQAPAIPNLSLYQSQGSGLPPTGLSLGAGVQTALGLSASGTGAICLASGSACASGSGQQPYPNYGAVDDTTGWSTVGAGSVSALTTSTDAAHTIVRMGYTGANNNPQISARVETVPSTSWTHAVGGIVEMPIIRVNNERIFGAVASNGTGYYYCGLFYNSGNTDWEVEFLKYATYSAAPSVVGSFAGSWQGYDTAPKYFQLVWTAGTSMACQYSYNGKIFVAVSTDSSSLITPPTQFGYGFDPGYNTAATYIDIIGVN